MSDTMIRRMAKTCGYTGVCGITLFLIGSAILGYYALNGEFDAMPTWAHHVARACLLLVLPSLLLLVCCQRLWNYYITSDRVMISSGGTWVEDPTQK